MWIGKAAGAIIEGWRKSAEESGYRYAGCAATCEHLRVENAQLRSEMNWFKHRLNQVERERGQLIQAAIGVKIAVPEFVPTYEDPGKALNDMPDLSRVGEDAAYEPTEPLQDGAVDYTMLPGYGKK